MAQKKNGYTHAEGFPPVFDGMSEVLVLGSFPSVRSRQVSFYYGNKQNRFWRTLCGFFGESVPESTEEKKAFVLRRHVALWDVVVSCDIVGSSDASICNEQIADIPALLNGGNIRKVLCNGNKAYSIFAEKFPGLIPLAEKLPSTSPANPRFSEEEWHRALAEIFGKEERIP